MVELRNQHNKGRKVRKLSKPLKRPPLQPRANNASPEDSLRTVRPRPLHITDKVRVLWAGRDPELYDIDGGAFYQWLERTEAEARRGDPAGSTVGSCQSQIVVVGHEFKVHKPSHEVEAAADSKPDQAVSAPVAAVRPGGRAAGRGGRVGRAVAAEDGFGPIVTPTYRLIPKPERAAMRQPARQHSGMEQASGSGEAAYIRFVAPQADELDAAVEYDMDDEDERFLAKFNREASRRRQERLTEDGFEAMINRFEKDHHAALQQRPEALLRLANGHMPSVSDVLPLAEASKGLQVVSERGIEQVYTYWKGKRTRNVRPLLHRLWFEAPWHRMGQAVAKAEGEEAGEEAAVPFMGKDEPQALPRHRRMDLDEVGFKLGSIRDDLELVRTLADQVRRREKLKKRRLVLWQQMLRQQLAARHVPAPAQLQALGAPAADAGLLTRTESEIQERLAAAQKLAWSGPQRTQRSAQPLLRPISARHASAPPEDMSAEAVGASAAKRRRLNAQPAPAEHAEPTSAQQAERLMRLARRAGNTRAVRPRQAHHAAAGPSSGGLQSLQQTQPRRGLPRQQPSTAAQPQPEPSRTERAAQRAAQQRSSVATQQPRQSRAQPAAAGAAASTAAQPQPSQPSVKPALCRAAEMRSGVLPAATSNQASAAARRATGKVQNTVPDPAWVPSSALHKGMRSAVASMPVVQHVSLLEGSLPQVERKGRGISKRELLALGVPGPVIGASGALNKGSRAAAEAAASKPVIQPAKAPESRPQVGRKERGISMRELLALGVPGPVSVASGAPKQGCKTAAAASRSIAQPVKAPESRPQADRKECGISMRELLALGLVQSASPGKGAGTDRLDRRQALHAEPAEPQADKGSEPHSQRQKDESGPAAAPAQHSRKRRAESSAEAAQAPAKRAAGGRKAGGQVAVAQHGRTSGRSGAAAPVAAGDARAGLGSSHLPGKSAADAPVRQSRHARLAGPSKEQAAEQVPQGPGPSDIVAAGFAGSVQADTEKGRLTQGSTCVELRMGVAGSGSQMQQPPFKPERENWGGASNGSDKLHGGEGSRAPHTSKAKPHAPVKKVQRAAAAASTSQPAASQRGHKGGQRTAGGHAQRQGAIAKRAAARRRH